jgi:hypothetical protein
MGSATTTGSRPPARPRRGAPVGHLALVATVVLLLVAAGLALSSGSVRGSASGAPSSGARAASAAPSDNVPCYSLNATICVSPQNSTIPDIIPPAGNHVSSVHPLPNQLISLYVRSEFRLDWQNAKTAGPLSPIQLNATAVLWNGVPYYNASSNTVWHPTGTQWWTVGPAGLNKSYPYYYGLNFSLHASNGAPSFFAGMAVTWWIYITTNTSGVIGHLKNLPIFRFTFGGAWPYSPYPAYPDYAGPGAAGEDLAVSQAPAEPNFDDSVRVTIGITPEDLTTNASIGGAYLDLLEYAPDGALVATVSRTFNVTVTGNVGQAEAYVQLSPALAQLPGALVEYRVTAWDTNLYGPDDIQTQTYNYTVNGNGTFLSGKFADDLSLSSTPAGVLVKGGLATVPAGAPLSIQLKSNNSGTSIFAAEIVYTFVYPATGENVTQSVAMVRDNSTYFNGTVPGMPLGAQVHLQVLAWDFAQTREVSTTFNYVTPTVASLLPAVPQNSSFFIVYVYDNGSHSWVSGANLEIVSSTGFVHVDATTFDGVAYPNQTGRAFVPLLLQAGVPYKVTLNDSAFHPGGVTNAPSVELTLLTLHNLSASTILAVGSDYLVAESGSAIYFWLNQTNPSFVYPEPTIPWALAGPLLGLGAFALGVIPLSMWYGRIRARREAEEKRITL